MKGLGRGLLGLLFFGVLVVGLAGLGVWRLGTASGQATVVRVVAPASVPVGGEFQVQIEIEGSPPPDAGCPSTDRARLCGLASYELMLRYDPNVLDFVAATNADFLTSTGRGPLSCPAPIVGPAPGLDAGDVRFGCATTGYEPSGPSGAGVLSRVTFSAKAAGASNLDLLWVSLSDWTTDFSIAANRQGDCVAVGTGATCTAPTVAPPATATAPAGTTVTPGGPTATPGAPLPTATPEGPLATPTPLPPGMEAVDLAAACNPVAATYPNATPVQTIAAAVGPAGNLQALWEFGGNAWLGYSPAYPQASDLTAMDFLDVVFICVGGPGSFARPIV